MAIALTPYIHFVNNAEEALSFYQGIFGGKVEINRFGDLPEMQSPEQFKKQLMHASLMADHIGLFISDSEVMGGVKQGGENISLSISGYAEDLPKLTEYFGALAEGGNITQPLETQAWGATFGMLTDKFGIHWMVNIDQKTNP